MDQTVRIHCTKRHLLFTIYIFGSYTSLYTVRPHSFVVQLVYSCSIYNMFHGILNGSQNNQCIYIRDSFCCTNSL